MDLRDPFIKGEYFPLPDHEERIERYRRNEKLAKGDHADVFKDNVAKTESYVFSNFPGLITRKSGDFLFGEEAKISSGKEDSSKEQEALDRITETNNMHRVNYQQALKAAITGDCFYKIRYGSVYSGAFPETYDPKRVIIEPVDPKKLYPQTSPFDSSKIVVYHIAEPVQLDPSDDKYNLFVESHYANKIVYRQFDLTIYQTDRFGNVLTFKIGDEIPSGYKVENTGVPLPLVVHVPNFTDGSTWEGQDDISEHIALIDELSNRLSQVAMILDKHADPSLAIPHGLLQEDGEGNTYFNVALNKVFEVMDKTDIIPQYVTNQNPQLDQAFKEIEMLLEFLLSASEIPAVAVGLTDSGGTSGNSGLSIKWRMAGLLAKVNRKRLFFDDGLKRVYMIAQMLEQYADPKIEKYEVTVPVIKYSEGLPIDDDAVASRMAVRTNGGQTLSRKTALMVMDGLTEEQADAELERIKEEQQEFMVADPSIFNEEASPGTDAAEEAKAEKPQDKVDNKQTNNKDSAKTDDPKKDGDK